MVVTDDAHVNALVTGTRLTQNGLPNAVAPMEVIRILNRARIKFVLVGVFGLGGWWKKPRACGRVEVIVPPRQARKASSEILGAFPRLQADVLPALVRLYEAETSKVSLSILRRPLVEIVKPWMQPLRDVFQHVTWVEAEGERYRIPNLEMAVFMKFAALTSHYRSLEDKCMDAHDFVLMVKKNTELDKNALGVMANNLYAEGSKDAIAMVEDAAAGRELKL